MKARSSIQHTKGLKRNIFGLLCQGRIQLQRLIGTSNHKLTGSSDEEFEHFNRLATSWWDVNGSQRILHKMNLLRMDFIRETIKSHVMLNDKDCSPDEEIYIPPYNIDLLPDMIKEKILEEQEMKQDEVLLNNKFNVLDIGCGGGIFSESIARMNFVNKVKGIDLSQDVIQAANLHKAKDPMLTDKLTYKLQAVEDLPKKEKYDIVTLFELLEHVNYPSKMLNEALDRVNPNGWLFLSTINRDLVSWFTTILMGEHLLRIVPVGTHNLKKYINHSEIELWLNQTSTKFEVVDSRGCIYIPNYGWKFTPVEKVGNYFMAIKRIK